MPPAASQDKKNNNSNPERLAAHHSSSRLAAMAASETSSSSLPPSVRVRLYELFVQIEREFEILHAENSSLHERVERLTRQQQSQQQLRQQLSQPHHYQPYGQQPPVPSSTPGSLQPPEGVEADTLSGQVKFQQVSSTPANQQPRTGLYAHKIKSHTNKLRAQTNRLMSNFKGQALNCQPVRRYVGHKDGIWEVTVSRMGLPLLGTASADHTAMIWGMHSGGALLQYAGHQGSVNSIR